MRDLLFKVHNSKGMEEALLLNCYDRSAIFSYLAVHGSVTEELIRLFLLPLEKLTQLDVLLSLHCLLQVICLW
jgi:hypothetical protein